MTTLHIIGSRQGLTAALPYLGQDDALLFHGDGCYDALNWQGPQASYWLEEDARARALLGRCDQAQALGWPQVVALTLDHKNSVTW
ncbi:DsrH/TusB family sulfur metabolism protein [Gallaecimonas sp. GXIMD4217]|uniref:DsrH/TusB family sulfur metabolism protein n=1 Tax=Gallaecimonas sp. GXIMD4217 TaxID=3131927 RepID=UPI00311B4037